MLHVLLLLFSHFIPAALGSSVPWSQPSSVHSSDVPQVLREHRDQIDIIRRTNHELELKNFTSRSDMSSDINNNNISKSNYINHDPITNRKIDGQRLRLATSTQQTDPFVLPSPTPTSSSSTSTSTSDSVANKSFRPSKLPTETAMSNLSEINPYTDARINGLYIDRAIICDCSINDTPISSGKRQQEPLPWCSQQCLSAKHRNRRNNIEQFPDKSFRLSLANSTTPNDMANQQHQWHTRPTPHTERPFIGLSSFHKQLSTVDLFFYCFRLQQKNTCLNSEQSSEEAKANRVGHTPNSRLWFRLLFDVNEQSPGNNWNFFDWTPNNHTNANYFAQNSICVQFAARGRVLPAIAEERPRLQSTSDEKKKRCPSQFVSNSFNYSIRVLPLGFERIWARLAWSACIVCHTHIHLLAI